MPRIVLLNSEMEKMTKRELISHVNNLETAINEWEEKGLRYTEDEMEEGKELFKHKAMTMGAVISWSALSQGAKERWYQEARKENE